MLISTGVPSFPLNLRSTASSDNSIDIEWQAPKHDGYSPITNYLIETSEPGTKDWRRIAVIDGSELKYRLNNLNTGSAYFIRVSAINDLGQSKRAAELFEPVYAKGSFEVFLNIGLQIL